MIFKIWTVFGVSAVSADPCSYLTESSYSKDGICHDLYLLPDQPNTFCARNRINKSWCLKTYPAVSVADAQRFQHSWYSQLTHFEPNNSVAVVEEDHCKRVHSDSFNKDGKCHGLYFVPGTHTGYGICFRDATTRSWCLRSFQRVMLIDVQDEGFIAHYYMARESA